jgi:phosphocarrier protein HPr
VIKREVQVKNALGLHARAAARFVQTATRYQSSVRVKRSDRVMDGKSIMGILLLAATKGSRLTVMIDGADEAEAMDALISLIETGFGEAPL